MNSAETLSACQIQGQSVPVELLGELEETSAEDSPESLKRILDKDGYVLIRAAVDREVSISAREEVFSRLAAVGEIRQPAVAGIATGTSQRYEKHANLGEFWRSVCSGKALREATHGQQMSRCMARLLPHPVAHDYMFLRPGRVGLSTRLHYDLPFFARGSKQILTAWLALGDIPVSEGTLMIVEHSNEFTDLIEAARSVDYDSNESPTVQLMDDAIEFVRSRKTRLLTAEFKAGDVIIFGMTTLHGTCDNHSEINRVRLSCDVRWQPGADPLDPRYVGSNPAGTTGIGYGELNGAKPLTEDWHTR